MRLPEGEVRKDMDATFAKWENAKRVERCNRGKRGKAEKDCMLAAGRHMVIFWMQKGLEGFRFIQNKPKSCA